MPKNEWKNQAYLNLIQCYWQSLVKLLFSSFRKPGLCLSWVVGCTTCFFYKQHYFSTQPQRFIAFSWIELLQNLVKVLLDTYRHLHTETFFIFTIFESMSRPRSIYVVSVGSAFHFHLHFHLHFHCD